MNAYKEATARGLFAGGPADGCVLAIVGSGSDADNEEVAAMHDPKNGVVVYNTFVSKDILRICYYCADVHVSASDFETLGNTVHESLLCGTPVVVEKAGGYISQVDEVEQGDTKQGFLVGQLGVPGFQRTLLPRCPPPTQPNPLNRPALLIHLTALRSDGLDKISPILRRWRSA